MKTPLLLALTFISFLAVSAQNDIPAFGKIDKEDLVMTDCDFDKGAVACKLIDWGNVYYERGSEHIGLFKQVIERRVRFKILKEKGLTYANVNIPFYSFNNDQKIIKIEAQTYNLDESGNIKITEAGKNSIYTKKINKRFSETIITFPEAKVGSVVEYKYKMEREMFWIINDWFFQDKIPTRYSEYQLKIPSILQFSIHPVVAMAPEVKEKVTEETIALTYGLLNVQMIKKNYILKQVPGIKDEPYMGSFKDYQQRLEFQLSKIDWGDGNSKDLRTNWTDVVKSLNEDEDFGLQLKKEIPDASTIIEEAKSLQGDETKIKFIYSYIKKTIQWDDEEDIYSFTGINKTWETKKGSTGDINLLLTALLKQIGLKAYPVLFSTRDHGLVNSLYPFISQFNIVLCHVQLGNKFLILDATDKYANYKLIPEKVTNTSGLIVMEEKGEWVDAIDDHKYKMMTALQGEIDVNGIMKGNCVVSSSDYARKERSELWRKDKEKFKSNYFTAYGTALTINELTVDNAEADSLPLEQKIKFTQPLSSSGDYKYFTINLFTEFGNNPFTDNERTTDIDFGFQKEFNIFGNFTIPEGYVFEELPKDIVIVTPDNGISFNRTMQAEDNLLNIRISIEFNKNFYTAGEYPEFKEFYKKMIEKLNEQIVLKKKVTP